MTINKSPTTVCGMMQDSARTFASAALLLAMTVGACADAEATGSMARRVVLPTPATGPAASPGTAGSTPSSGQAGIAAGSGSTAGSAANPVAGGGIAPAPSPAGAMAPPRPPPTTTTPWSSGAVDKQPKLPAPPADCPQIATGMITVMGQQVRVWVGPKKGPMVFYWHGTGSRAEEAISGLGPGLNEITSQGGVVASFTTTTKMGQTTANNVWYSGDFEMADQILACAHAQGLIEPQHIY